MIRMTKGQRTEMRDQFKLRMNQALWHTNLQNVYGAVNERFELETEKVGKTTTFKVTGSARVEGALLQYSIEATPTGAVAFMRPVFKVSNILYGNVDIGRKELPKLEATGDLIQIGPNIFKGIVNAFREQLPEYQYTLAELEKDRTAAHEFLEDTIRSCAKKCFTKTFKLLSVGFRKVGRAPNIIGKPYYAEAVFEYGGETEKLEFMFERIGRERAFELKSATMRDVPVDFNVSPFTLENAVQSALRNAIVIVKLSLNQSKGNKMETTKTAAPKKPAAKKAPAKLNGQAAPIAQLAQTIHEGKKPAVKKTAKVIVNGELKDAPKTVEVVKKSPAKKIVEVKPAGGYKAGEVPAIRSAKTPASKQTAGKQAPKDGVNPKRVPREKGQKDLAMISDAINGANRQAKANAQPPKNLPKVTVVKLSKVWEAAHDTELRQLLDQQLNLEKRIDLLKAAKVNGKAPEVQAALDSKQFDKDRAFIEQIKGVAKLKKFTFKASSEEGNDVYRLTGKLQSGHRFCLSIEYRPRAAIRFVTDVMVHNGSHPELPVEELNAEIKTLAQFNNLLARIEREAAKAPK